MSSIVNSKTNVDPSLHRDDALPKHIAIIMDGNGRWAKARNLPRTAGHKHGADALHRTLDACLKHNIDYLTIYAFSSENWQRPAQEVSDLMSLLQHYLHQELQTLHENNIRLRFIGDMTTLAPDIRTQMNDATTLTARNTSFHFTVAISYGARQEMVRAVRRIVESGTTAEAITEEMISHALDTTDLPEPDLLIRTGGEQRLSNFLLWQSAYTELYFTPLLWPDFNEAALSAALLDYAGRERRFGKAEA